MTILLLQFKYNIQFVQIHYLKQKLFVIKLTKIKIIYVFLNKNNNNH